MSIKTQIFGYDFREFEDALKELFGTVVRMTREEFVKKYFAEVSREEAEVIADKWIKNAERVTEPSRD